MGSAISAYVPCFNNAETIEAVLRSLHAQTVALDEIFVVDDASTDLSCDLAEKMGVRVVRMPSNLGRGAVRAAAMREARHALVLSCDATNTLAPDFLERALPWMDTPLVAAVFGRICPVDLSTPLLRWRARHLFRADEPGSVAHGALLATWGVLMRKEAAEAVGGFDPSLRHTEDADLGTRLLAGGYDVVSDPALKAAPLRADPLGRLLERYWRWNAGKEERILPRHYLRQISYSIKVQAAQDLRAGDLACVPISLLLPHYQFWRSVWRRVKRQRR